MIIFYVPCKNKREAREIAKELLEQRIIACANIMPSESIYEWEGKIQTERESILLIKTVDRHEEKVRKVVEKIHSYDLPAIIKLNGRANDKYLKWMESCIK